MCACCCCVYMIKMTCFVNWIIVRERRAQSQPHSSPDLDGSRGKTVSIHLKLSPDAVDDHDFFSALSCSSCSTTCCCIAVWAVESVKWFLRPSYRSRLYIAGTGKSRYVVFFFFFVFFCFFFFSGCLLLDGLLHKFGQQLYRSSNSGVLCRQLKKKKKKKKKKT